MAAQENDLEEKYKLIGDTIRAYPAQLVQAWNEVKGLKIPDAYMSVENVVFCGMGGSALGARIVDALTESKLRIPLEIFNGYDLPNYVGRKTLIIVQSYSGNTEEAVSCANKALSINTNLFGITTGGKLKEIFLEENVSSYIIDPKHNPSKQPRMAIGYAAGAVISLFSKLGFISLTDEQVHNAGDVMHKAITQYQEGAPENNNLAKLYAKKLKGKIPILVASQHLVGMAHTIKNQFNESAKTFSALFELPELNHHLMEGLTNPKKLKEIFIFVFFQSKLYSENVLKRYPLTTEVVEKNNVDHIIFELQSENKLNQLFELLVFGSFVVYYLTKEYDIDPTEIPWVDYFKDKLKK